MSPTKNLRSDKVVQYCCPISDFWWETSDLKTNGGESWLKCVEILVQHLWRAAGTGAEAPPLAARPNSGIDKFVDGQSAISRILGGGNRNGNRNPEWSSQVSFRITHLKRNSETIHCSDVHSDDDFGSDLFGNGM